MPAPRTLEEFVYCLQAALADGTLVRLVLSGLRGNAPAVAGDRIDVRPLNLRGQLGLQWTERRARQEFHENLSSADSCARLQSLLKTVYRHATLRTATAETDLRVTRRGRVQITTRCPPTLLKPPPTSHNRAVEHILPDGVPCHFLEAIGVMTAEGRVRSAQQHKFRQINRYLEFIRDVVPELPDAGPLQIVDCGCGKSGLTFALHHFLTHVAGRDVQLTGLDWNADVIAGCRDTADRLGLSQVQFAAGDIASYQPAQPVHLVVSLHACDTATDAALAQAVRWQSDLILAVPCCQHELAPQLSSAALQPLLQHGILRERLAADVTDALRAALLECHGYRTQVLEFIELEHTPKNLLLRAVRRREPLSQAARDRTQSAYLNLKAVLGIESFALERMLTTT